MLHLGDIKIAQSTNRAVIKEQQGTKPLNDFSSDASFFSILKGQVQYGDQVSPIQTSRPEPARNSVNTLTDDRAPREEVARHTQKDEQVQAVGKSEDQGQKASARIQDRENKSADVKHTMEKKPAPEQQGALAEKADAGNRARQNRKEKKTADSDMRDIQESLHRMIDLLKGKEQPELRSVKASVKEFHDLLSDPKKGADRWLVKKSLDKLSDAIEGLAAKIKSGKNEHLAGALAGVRDMAKKMKAAGERNQQRNQGATDTIAPAVKDLLVRMETVVEAMKGDGAHHRPGSGDQGNTANFSFTGLKSDMAARQPDAAVVTQKNSIFRENLENIIQNAKVVVRDSRNGSFSVRLHPEELGTVNISLSLHDGVVRGKFLVETQDAKDLLAGNLENIKQQLSEAGIAVGEFQVDVNDQRGRMLYDRGDDRAAYIAPAEQQVEIESEYMANAAAYHDGRINLVI